MTTSSWWQVLIGIVTGSILLGSLTWTILQNELATLKDETTLLRHQLELNRSEYLQAFMNIRETQQRRSGEFVHVDANHQFEKAIDYQLQTLAHRLEVLEQTRPTTGELKSVQESTTARIDKLYGLIQSQEDYLRALTTPRNYPPNLNPSFNPVPNPTR